MTRDLAGFHRGHSAANQIGLEDREHVLNDPNDSVRVQALHPQPDYGRFSHTGNRKKSVKVSVQRYNDGLLVRGQTQDLIVGCPRHSNLADMSTHMTESAQKARGISRNSLIQDQMHHDA